MTMHVHGACIRVYTDVMSMLEPVDEIPRETYDLNDMSPEERHFYTTSSAMKRSVEMWKEQQNLVVRTMTNSGQESTVTGSRLTHLRKVFPGNMSSFVTLSNKSDLQNGQLSSTEWVEWDHRAR